MTREIFAIVTHVQEVLISMQEEDEFIRKIMRTTPSIKLLGKHFRMLRHYASRLQPLLDEFEAETFKEQLEKRGKSREAAYKVRSS